MAFEPYKRAAGQPPSENPTFRISPDAKVLSLNSKATGLLGENEYVKLLFDEDTREMALEPTSEAGDYSFKVNRSGKNLARGTVGVGGFTAVHRIEGGQTLNVRTSQGGRLMIANVGDPVSE